MSGLYVKLDVEYASDDKMIAAGPLGELLYIRSLAFCKKNPTTDGWISSPQLAHVGVGIPNLKRHAAKLCEVGAWTSMNTGWFITAWLKRNRSSADIQAQLKMASDLGIQGNHDRWHVGETGKPNVKCVICVAEHHATRSGTPTPPPSGNPIGGSSPKEEEETKPEEKPEAEPQPKEETKPKSSSSPPSDLQAPVDNSEEDEDRILIDNAMETVVDRLTRKAHPEDAFSYANTLREDSRHRRDDLAVLHKHHPHFSAFQLADAHLGRSIEWIEAEIRAANEPPVIEEPAEPYVPLPYIEPEKCPGCKYPQTFIDLRGCQHKRKPGEDTPPICFHEATVATVTPIRQETM
jgi:hypothetical protein